MDPDGRVFDGEAVARLRRVIARLARTLHEPASAEGLSPSQASVLTVIGARGPLALAELAEVEHINPTMLSRIVSKLDGLELIRRSPSPDDQRVALVEVTEAGRRTSERIREHRTDTVTRVLDKLPAATTTALVLALPALEALAGMTDHDRPPLPQDRTGG